MATVYKTEFSSIVHSYSFNKKHAFQFLLSDFLQSHAFYHWFERIVFNLFYVYIFFRKWCSPPVKLNTNGKTCFFHFATLLSAQGASLLCLILLPVLSFLAGILMLLLIYSGCGFLAGTEKIPGGPVWFLVIVHGTELKYIVDAVLVLAAHIVRSGWWHNYILTPANCIGLPNFTNKWVVLLEDAKSMLHSDNRKTDWMLKGKNK